MTNYTPSVEVKAPTSSSTRGIFPLMNVNGGMSGFDNHSLYMREEAVAFKFQGTRSNWVIMSVCSVKVRFGSFDISASRAEVTGEGEKEI